MLVHNKNVVDELNKYSINTLYDDNKSLEELITKVKDGIIIFTAHGHSKKLEELANNQNLTIVDSICPMVKKVRDVIANNIDKYKIIYIAKKNHPESNAIISDYPNINLIENENDIDKLSPNDNYLLVNQTTLSSYDVEYMINLIEEKCKNVTKMLDICPVVKQRQQQLMNIPTDIDLIYIIGDPHSSNTNRLYEIALSNYPDIKVKKIATVLDINNGDLDKSSHVAIASGTSTPTNIVNEVIDYISNY